MNIYERIKAAEEKFYSKFETGADEWSELFYNGSRFATGLEGCGAEALREDVVRWLEKAAEAEPAYDE